MRFSKVCILVMASLLLVGFGYRQPAIAAEVATVTVTVEYPNASADTMAVAVTAPLERQFSTIAGVSQVTAVSTAGSTKITVELEGNRDIDAATLDVQSAVSEVSLPQDLPTAPVVARGGR